MFCVSLCLQLMCGRTTHPSKLQNMFLLLNGNNNITNDLNFCMLAQESDK